MLRILLVDDDELVLRSLRRMLERAGHVVVATTTLGEGRSIALRDELDVVITDAYLRDGSGLELARELQRERPALRVVILSGHDVDTDIPLLAKPIRALALLAAIGSR